jgi:MFS family permease
MTVPTSTRLLNTNFVLYLIGLGCTALADAILFVALPFVVLGSGGTQQELAIVVLCGSLPRFAALFLGVLADRLAPRRLLIGTALVRTLIVVGVGWAALNARADVSVLAVFALLNSLLVTLTIAAGSVIVPRLVAERDLAQGNSLVGVASMGLPLLGIGLAGLLINFWGSTETLLLTAPLYFLLVLTTMFMRPSAAVKAEITRPSLLHDFLEGLRIRLASRVLMFMLLFTFLLNFILNVINVRAPIFATIGGRGASDYALFEGLFSVGALLGISVVGVLSRKLGLRVLFGLALMVFTLGMVAFAVPTWNVWFLANAITGLSVGLLDVASMTQMQMLVPDGVRGRVMGTSISVGALGLSLGAVVAGLNVSTSMLMGLLGGILAFLSLTWMVWRDLHHEQPATEPV